jgi:PRTRC genetic system protein E
MFNALSPLLQQRSIHILLSAGKDGNMNMFIEPVKLSDKEDAAFTVPFTCSAKPGELDAELPQVLSQWIASRDTITTPLAESLAAAEAATKAAAEAAKKVSEERAKKNADPKVGSKAATKKSTNAATVATPTL